MRWFLLLACACSSTHAPLDATLVAENRGTVTAMALGDGTLYWAVSGGVSVNMIWAMSSDEPALHGSTYLRVTSMAAVEGKLFLAGDGGTTILGAEGPVMVRRSNGTHVDVVEPRASSFRAVYLVDEMVPVGVAAGHVAIGARSYALDGGDYVDYAIERPRLVMPTQRGLVSLHGFDLYENTRRLGEVGDPRWFAERGDELWAIGEDELSVWRDGALETFAAPGPIDAIASDGSELYLASDATIWRVE